MHFLNLWEGGNFFSHLDCFFELDAEVLEDAEALVQLEGVLVLAEEVDERAPLPAQVHPASLQVLERVR